MTADPQIARQLLTPGTRTHGRIQILNEESAKNPPGMAPTAQLVHGGPGRAGGGEELEAVLRAIEALHAANRCSGGVIRRCLRYQ